MSKPHQITTAPATGTRSAGVEAQLAESMPAQRKMKARVNPFYAATAEHAGLYRRLRLPPLPDRQAEILRKPNVEELRVCDLLVKGSNAFLTYEFFFGAKLPTGNKETGYFDLASCPGNRVSLAAPPGKKSNGAKTLFGVLKRVNNNARISKRKPNQAVSSDSYKVDFPAAPGTHPLPRKDAVDPTTTLIKQKWHLKRTVVSIVLTAVRRHADLLMVAELQSIALHRLCPVDQLESRADKKVKDRCHGTVLLDSARCFLQPSHPLNFNFSHKLNKKQRLHFDQKCLITGFTPQP